MNAKRERSGFIPAMELISMFIRLETGVKLSGGNWQQLWRLCRIESNEIKCGKKWALVPLHPSCRLHTQEPCVFVLTLLQKNKADICIMVEVAPALTTASLHQIFFFFCFKADNLTEIIHSDPKIITNTHI